MRSIGSRGLLVTTAGWAVIGLLLGHVAAYDLVFPDAHVHDAALAESGHAWLELLQPSLLIAVGLLIVAALLSARAGGAREVRFRRLAVIQVVAFVAVELGERAMAGYSPLDLWHALVDHGLWLILAVGVVAQVITAWLGSTASRGIAAVTRAPRSDLPHASRRAPRLALHSRNVIAPQLVVTRHGRAPPAWVPSLGSM